MNYSINFNNYKNNFTIPSLVVENLKEVNSDYLKVILMIFRNPDKHYSINLLSNLLDMEETLIENAINYWIENNLLTLDEDKTAEKTVHKVSSKSNVLTEKKVSNDTELAFLLENMEACLNRSVTSTDLKTVTYIYEYYRLPADVILMAMAHSRECGNKSIKYLEKLCVDWYEKGIDSHDSAEEYLKLVKERQGKLNKLKEKFGINSRGLIPSEEKFAKTWFDEYKFSFEMIVKAFEITIEKTGKVAFAYTNKILQNWHNNGFTTLEQVDFTSKANKNTQSKQNNSYDFDMLDEYWNTVPKLD